MRRERYLKTLRALAECYQTFERVSAAHLRQLGLTAPQFDIVATLGNTAGMTFKELGEKSLITKGTLTGVVDRLEARGIVQRIESPTDKRCTIVALTLVGQQQFDAYFPKHIAFLKQPFDALSEDASVKLENVLWELQQGFQKIESKVGLASVPNQSSGE